MSHITYNFYYPKDLFITNISTEELTSKSREFILNRAKPWPSQDALFIDGDVIIIVLTDDGLAKARASLR